MDANLTFPSNSIRLKPLSSEIVNPWVNHVLAIYWLITWCYAHRISVYTFLEKILNSIMTQPNLLSFFPQHCHLESPISWLEFLYTQEQESVGANFNRLAGDNCSILCVSISTLETGKCCKQSLIYCFIEGFDLRKQWRWNLKVYHTYIAHSSSTES